MACKKTRFKVHDIFYSSNNFAPLAFDKKVSRGNAILLAESALAGLYRRNQDARTLTLRPCITPPMPARKLTTARNKICPLVSSSRRDATRLVWRYALVAAPRNSCLMRKRDPSAEAARNRSVAPCIAYALRKYASALWPLILATVSILPLSNSALPIPMHIHTLALRECRFN